MLQMELAKRTTASQGSAPHAQKGIHLHGHPKPNPDPPSERPHALAAAASSQPTESQAQTPRSGFLGFGLPGVLGNRHRMDANVLFPYHEMNGRFSAPDSEQQQGVGHGHVAGG